ncbi:creatininase family protein [Clostridioides difficile]
MNYNLLTLSWEDIFNLDKEKLVVFVGIAPIEEYGRHLPIGVDIYETDEWINLAIEKLDSILPSYCYGKLPIIPFGFADMGPIFNCEQKGILRKLSNSIEEKIKMFPNDFHAGWIETSNMLALYPELVNDNYQERPDISIQDNEMMNIQKVINAIKNEGHIGFPKEASKELGIELNNDIGEQICIATHNFILRSNYEKYMNHPLYHVPNLKLKI